MPSQVSGFQLQNEQNLGKLAALPQEQQIAKVERDKHEKFQTLQQMLSALDDPSLKPEQRKVLLGNGIDQVVDRTQGVPEMKLADGGRASAKANAYKQYFRELLDKNPDELRRHIRESMSALSMTQQGTQAYDLKELENFGKNTATLLHADPEPRADSASSMKEAEVLRKYMSDETRKVYGDANLAYKLDQLGFLIDSVGQMSVKPGVSPDKDHLRKAQELRSAAQEEVARRTQGARIKFYQTTGIKPDEFTGGGSAPVPQATKSQLTPEQRQALINSSTAGLQGKK
jgi:hypothetical protein